MLTLYRSSNDNLFSDEIEAKLKSIGTQETQKLLTNQKSNWLGHHLALLAYGEEPLNLQETLEKIQAAIQTNPGKLKDCKYARNLKEFLCLLEWLFERSIEKPIDDAVLRDLKKSVGNTRRFIKALEGIKVDRHLLSKKCPALNSLLNFESEERETDSFSITCTTQDIVEQVGSFVNQGKCRIDRENCFELLDIAECYQLKKLKKQCEEWMINNLDRGTVNAFLGKVRSKGAENSIFRWIFQTFFSESDQGVKEALGAALQENSSRLTQLDFSKMNVSGQMLDHVLDMLPDNSAVKELHLTEEIKPYLDIIFEKVVKKCPSLEAISLELKSISDDFIKKIAQNFPNLRLLKVSDCQSISDDSIIAIAGNCHNLQILDLNSCPLVTDNSIIAIADNCPYFQVLNLSYCPLLTDNAVIAVANRCSQLRSLCVDYCELLTDASIKALAASSANLQSLRIDFCSLLTDAAIIAVANKCSKLQSLSVVFCTLLTDASIKAIGDHCFELQSLNVGSCPSITDASITVIGNNCRDLRSLNANRCTLITDASIAAVAHNCPELRSLNTNRCRSITDASISIIGRHCPKLRSLNVEMCSVTDHSITVIGNNCPRLRSLNTPACALTDFSVMAVASNCLELEDLNLNGCKLITDDSITAIANNCPDLRALALYNCELVTNRSIAEIAQKCPLLTNIVLGKCPKITEQTLEQFKPSVKVIKPR